MLAELTDQKFSDEYADIEIDLDGVKGCLGDLKTIKQQYPHIKTILSVGGGGEGSAPFPLVANSSIVRSMFAQSAKNMVDAYGLDGIDSKTHLDFSFSFNNVCSRLGAAV